MILGRFPASDDTGPVAPPGVFARVAELEAEVERLRRVETAARAYAYHSETLIRHLAWTKPIAALDALRAALEGRT